MSQVTQVSNEIAVTALAKKIATLDWAAPAMGMGKSWMDCIEEACRELGLTINDIDVRIILPARPKEM